MNEETKEDVVPQKKGSITLARLTAQPTQNGLVQISQAVLPMRTAWKVKNLIEKAQKESSNFDSLRQALIERHGARGDDKKLVRDSNGSFRIPQENVEAFNKEIVELMNIEVEIGTLSIAELDGKVELSANAMQLLDTLLVD